MVGRANFAIKIPSKRAWMIFGRFHLFLVISLTREENYLDKIEKCSETDG